MSNTLYTLHMGFISTVTTKGQITLPKEIRDILGIVPNQHVSVLLGPDGSVLVRPIPDFFSLTGKTKSNVKYDDRLADKAVAKGFVADYLKSHKK